MKSKRERERYDQLNAEFQRIAQRDKKAFFNEYCITLAETTERKRLEISSGRTENIKGTFHPKTAQ